MRTPIVLLAAIALLAACSTAEQKAYNADPAHAMAPQYGAGCEKLGYAKESAQWRSCILRSSTRNDLAQWGNFWIRQPQMQAWDRTH